MRHFSGAGNPGTEDFLQHVAREVESLGTGDVLTIADFGPDQATFREIRLDPAGTPRGRAWPTPWPTLMRENTLSVEKLSRLLRPGTPGRLLLGFSGPADEASPPGAGDAGLSGAGDAGTALAVRALNQATRLYPDAPVFTLDEPVGDLVRRAISQIPLSQWYELATVRESADGSLALTTQPLFPPGALRDDQRAFGFEVEPAERAGTVFAVLAREDEADPPDYRVVQPLRSAPLPPGRYEVTATLLGRGRVRFEDLPEPLGDERRSWAEVRAAVPRRVPRIAPAHLIIAIELCGPQVLYAQHVDCAVRLIEKVADGARSPVRYSLVGYGSHSFVRMTPGSPLEEACWADSDPAALGALNRLAGRTPLTSGSVLGAKLECALEFIAGRLAAGGDTGERPVLVTIGTRPPFPPGYQGRADALPCPDRTDWSMALNSIASRHHGTAFGAVYGGGDPPPKAWKYLGRDARGVPSGFDARQFAISLGLIGPAPAAFPLPLIEDEGH